MLWNYVLIFVHSLGMASFEIHLDSLTELFFALYHTNPVYLKDMTELPNRHLNVATELHNGNFMIRKNGRVLSSN